MRLSRKQDGGKLWEEILRFKKYKIPLMILLVVIGGLGLLVPIIPGLLFLLLALALFKPGLMKKIRSQLREWKI